MPPMDIRRGYKMLFWDNISHEVRLLD